MGSFQDQNEVLKCLGLTSRQAKVYLSLIRTGLAKVLGISEDSYIPREDLYRILFDLQKISLVEKTITIPTMYRATPLYEAIPVLLAHKDKEYKKLQTKTLQLLHDTIKDKIIKKFPVNEPQYILVPGKEPCRRKFREMAENSQESISLMVGWNILARAGSYSNVLSQALKRGAKIRMILEKTNLEKTNKVISQFVRKNNFEVRFASSIDIADFGLFDYREVLISTSAGDSFALYPALWSNNMSLIGIIQSYFEMMWPTLQKETLQETSTLN